ncbi:hypothetical protein [Streptosporangium sp. NBC_01756]|uniref:hypothetical protein n=1 Tax=Streptosporangium sp. NBC_01756 TaxID=2975950 RepID=UPI002DDC20C4|nr:hypothetical protein [Streptosporangium sp. NBC_01756]WSC83040.1 hypothetical protein OIE48_21685 [Streptosporangium sp. NBC_01756]
MQSVVTTQSSVINGRWPELFAESCRVPAPGGQLMIVSQIGTALSPALVGEERVSYGGRL